MPGTNGHVQMRLFLVVRIFFVAWVIVLVSQCCSQKHASRPTSNIWKMLRSKSMSRSQYLHSLCKVFVSVLSCGNVLILFLKQVGGHNTVLERV